MAAVMAVPPLAPRPLPAHNAWNPSMPFLDSAKENRPALKQLQQSAPAARTRKERPCDGCRRRKSKCVLQDSRRCVLCEFHKQDCTFVEKAQPRKRKLEDGTVIEGPAKKSPTTHHRTTSTPTAPKHPPLPTPVVVPQPTSKPPRHPFAVDESLSLQRHRHCKLLGQTTPLDASLIALGTFNTKNETESKAGTLRQVGGSEYFSTHADADVPVPDDETRALADIEAVVGQHGPALIDVYFRNVHPAYPIIQRSVFLDRFRHGDMQFNPPLLAAMYLLALSWWEREPELAGAGPKPDVAKLEYIATTSLTIAMQRPKISAVQAGLLLLQRAKASTWTLTVQLVALGQDIGLHLDSTTWSIPEWERRLRKRLAWALYIQDKWSALMHGRPSHINAADWAVRDPDPSDFDENTTPFTASPTSPADEDSAEREKGITIFTQMIQLTRLLSDITATFYSQTAKAEHARAGRYAPQLVLNRAKPVQLRLKEWFATLPAACKMDNYTPGTLSATGYLHLAYFATEITIHRRIVTSLDPALSDPYLLYICRSAAKTRLISALDFVNRLRPEHLEAFWFAASAANFGLIGTFGALLQATSPGREEAEFYEARLREFRWTLGVNARRAGWMEGAVGVVEGNGEMLGGLPEKPGMMGLPGTGTRGRAGAGAGVPPVPRRADTVMGFSVPVTGQDGGGGDGDEGEDEDEEEEDGEEDGEWQEIMQGFR